MSKIGFGPVSPPAKPRRPLDKAPPFRQVFEELLPCYWRNVDFPIMSLETEISHDLAEHRYYGRDGASVEATGRAPMVFTATIPFVNGIVPGKNELWKQGDLFPVKFLDFVAAFGDRTDGVFGHPQFGEVNCKPQRMRLAYEAERRDGVIVTASWVESDEEDANSSLDFDSDIEADVARVDLTASMDDIRGMADEFLPAGFEEDFASLMNKLSGAIDRVTTSAALAKGLPNQVLFHVDQLQGSIERARNTMSWPVVDACERMRAAMLNLPNIVTSGGRKVLRYTTPAQMTLGAIVSAIGTTTMDDLIKLNPSLISRPEVPAGTVVRYYAP